MDESRFGLLPIFRRVWSPKGVRPIKPVRLKYEWTYLFSVVEPTSGRTFSMLWDSVSLPVMQAFLDEYGKSLADNEICLMVLDGAGWHSENGLNYPKNIIPLKQPAYSPECNPTESLWDWVKDKLGIRLYDTIDELKTRLIDIVNQFDDFKMELQSRLSYSWWIDSVIQA
jgi:hypothetical protein